MKPHFPKSIFIFTSRSINPLPEIHHSHTIFQVSHFATSAGNPFHSTPNSSYPSRRHEEESRNVKVSVWWDFENCNLPTGANVFKVAPSITAAVRANGIKGPIQITAFGDVLQLSRSNQDALSSTGINLAHIPNGGKNSADRSLLIDLMCWVSQNPPPAHLFLISGDRDFAGALHRLRMNNYNILLASPDTASGVLCSAASIMWHWNALLKGENLTGKHFNQPPDGPYGSWYGHYKVPLEDPFFSNELAACSRTEESSDFLAEPKPRPVPKVVLKQIRNILDSYPKGISITGLRAELSKRNVSLDRDLYGYKKFSRFLLALPQILRVQLENDGQYFVHGVSPKFDDVGGSTRGIAAGIVMNCGNQDLIPATKIKNGDSSCAEAVDEKLSSQISREPNVKEHHEKLKELNVKKPRQELEERSEKWQELPKKVIEQLPAIEKVKNAELTGNKFDKVEEFHPNFETGSFKRKWTIWLFGEDDDAVKKGSKEQEVLSTSSHGTKNIRNDENYVKLTGKCADSGGPASSNIAAVKDENIPGSSGTSNDKLGNGPGFFRWMLRWCNLWRARQDSDKSIGQSFERMSHRDDYKQHERFSKKSFWNDMMSFLDTPQGSELILQSRSREHLVQNLHKQGPQVLSCLTDQDLLHMVDMLISDKKWVEECTSQPFPFKLTRHAGNGGSSRSNNTPLSSGFRSLFSPTSLQSSAQPIPENNGEKRLQNPPHTGVFPPPVHNKPFGKSRSEMLIDCQKLVDEVMKEHPEGFNLAAFRKHFFDKYGYVLDLQKLGYKKLTTLLQTMPQVQIESTCIVPCDKIPKDSNQETVDQNVGANHTGEVVSNSDSESLDASRKDDDFESTWDELGPAVASKNPKNNEMKIIVGKMVEATVGQGHHEYEMLSDDDFSDSEEESSSSTRSDGQEKLRMNREDSSLLQILDSWYSSKEDSTKRVGNENVDGVVDCAGINTKVETPVANYGRRQRTSKNIMFVSEEPHDDDKDRLIDGILGSLKQSTDKSGEPRMKSC